MGSIKADGKKKGLGPQSYNLDKSINAMSNYRRLTVNVNISGMSRTDGSKPDLTHAEKTKVKSSRFLDMVLEKATKKGAVPGVGHYQVDKALTKVSTMPRTLRSMRH